MADFFLRFYRANFCDILLAFLYTDCTLTSFSERERFYSQKTNSFLSEQIVMDERGKKYYTTYCSDEGENICNAYNINNNNNDLI